MTAVFGLPGRFASPFAFPRGNILPGATGPAGVTQEHLPGPKTARFSGGRSRIFPDPVPDPVFGACGSVWSTNMGGIPGQAMQLGL